MLVFQDCLPAQKKAVFNLVQKMNLRFKGQRLSRHLTATQIMSCVSLRETSWS